jgi:hypothetical protein
VDLTFKTAPDGLTLTVGSGETTTTTPFVQTWVVNSQVQVIAPKTQVDAGVDYGFSKWSDGGASTHTFNAPTGAKTYTATYGPRAPGYVLDGYGGLHTVGSLPKASGGPYWPGWDIARGIAAYPNGFGGYELDAFGGLHPFVFAGQP